MEIVITKKASYFLIFLLVLSIFLVSTSADIVDTNKAFQSLDQIVTLNGTRVDFDNNSIIDYADEALSTKWDNVVNEGFKCAKNEYLVGFKGNAPICRRLRIDCMDDEIMCKLSFYTDPDYNPEEVGELRSPFNSSFFTDFNGSNKTEPDYNQTINASKIRALYFVKETTNTYWASLANEIVRIGCTYGVCEINYRQNISNPYAITFQDGLVKVGTFEGNIFSLNPNTDSCDKIGFGSKISALTYEPGVGLIAADQDLPKVGIVGRSTNIIDTGIDGYAMDVGNVDGARKLFVTQGSIIKSFTLSNSGILTDETQVDITEELGDLATGDEDFQSIYYASGSLFIIIDEGGVGLFDVLNNNGVYEELYTQSDDPESNQYTSITGYESEVYVLELSRSESTGGIVRVISSNTGRPLAGRDIELPEENDGIPLLNSCS